MVNLFGWVLSALSGVFSWIAVYFGARAALVAMAVTAYAAVAAVALACMNSIFDLLGDLQLLGTCLSGGLCSTALAYLWSAVFWCIPDNLTTVIAATLGADACAFLWRYKSQIIGDLAAMK